MEKEASIGLDAPAQAPIYKGLLWGNASQAWVCWPEEGVSEVAEC